MIDPVRSYDPMLWVDPVTDRVFTTHNFPPLVFTQMIWSDDNGDKWTHHPAAFRYLPVLDYQKVATGVYGPDAPATGRNRGDPLATSRRSRSWTGSSITSARRR